MRTIEVSDELFEQLKGFVVDPFDDTPEAVITRLIEIVNKAKNRWSPLETHCPRAQVEPRKQPVIQPAQEPTTEEEPIVVL